MAAAPYSNADTNRFWLQILGDNALIIHNALSPNDTENARRARAFTDLFDALALRANQDLDANQTALINKDAYQAAQDLRRFFLQILRKSLTEEFHLDLKPVLINGFVTETEIYLDHLNAFMHNRQPTFNMIDEEIFWLLAFTFHSRYIADNVGYYQREYREKAREYSSTIYEFWSASVELKELSRIGTEDFPMAREHHMAVVNVLNEYYELLTSLVALQQRQELPGSMSLLYMDRSRRMVCHFLKQVSVFLGTQAPDCDPYAQRISSY